MKLSILNIRRLQPIWVGVIWTILISLSACEETATIGFPLDQPRLITSYVDSFNIKTSTVILDSAVTSGKGRLLIGQYTNSSSGKISSSTYFQVSPPPGTSFTPPTEAIFDSLTLVLKYDKYWYGDTTATLQLNAFELTENITERRAPQYLYVDTPLPIFTSSRGLYNTSKTDFQSPSIGSLEFVPKPVSGDSIFIKLSEDLGKEWFSLALDNNVNSSTFTNFFKGLVIQSMGSDDGSIIGYDPASAHTRLYYHTINNLGFPESYFFDFPLSVPEIQYNEIAAERNSTPLELAPVLTDIASNETNNLTYIQGGSAVFTKIELPNLRDLGLFGNNYIILSARLLVKPIMNQKTQPLPPSLGLYEVVQNNIVLRPLGNGSSGSGVANLVADPTYGNAQYVFSITETILNWVNTPTFSGEVLLGLPQGALPASVENLRIGDYTNLNSNIKLELFISRIN